LKNELVFQIDPVWEKIEEAREASSNLLESNKYSRDTIDAISMIARELLENAVKYGNYENSVSKISLTLTLEKRYIIVEVSNPIREDKNIHLRKLDKTIQWIRGFQNPFEAYISRLKYVAVKPLDSFESGLGLVRIAYEGQGILDFIVDEEYSVHVSAVFDLQS
jgi:hypothetical protein